MWLRRFKAESVQIYWAFQYKIRISFAMPKTWLLLLYDAGSCFHKKSSSEADVTTVHDLFGATDSLH